MNDVEIYEVQMLLYVWLNKLGRRSLESIKASCNYLAEIHQITTKYPIWDIFWPLVFSGVVDHTGKGYYALTEPIILKYATHYFYINNVPTSDNYKELSVGIFISDNLKNEHNIKVITTNPKAILRQFPSVDKVVDGFSKSIQDETELKYYDWKNKKGVAQLKDGRKFFYSDPDKAYLRELPDRTVNPEAFAIAYCYGRTVSGEGNGHYYVNQKKLIMPSFAIPFTLFRALQLEIMASRMLPQREGDTYIFDGISAPIVKELNRILCNSIIYERPNKNIL